MKNLKKLFTGFGKTAGAQKTHSCCSGHEHSHEHSHEQDVHAGTIYRCPMKCEGQKTYDAPGRCPVCGMYLKPVTNGKAD
ncbi:heavy metal-binding domain-containing protein [Gaoshiqia sp. Z1-71]|uniref:heavy metal-binding domain-containing protein n=1 Tax=Gaoshiqia hydrogeniformans TaxID=3290090 RepID=UPI003BF81CE1